MVAAMEAVKGSCSVKRAAEEHGVPRTTLQDRIVSNVTHGVNPGPTSYLNKEEESDLANFLETVSSIGYGKTRKQIKALVETTVRAIGTLRKDRMTDGWFRQFL